MKHPFRLTLVALLVTLPCWSLAAEKNKKNRKNRPVAEQPATPAAETVKPIQDPASPWRSWSDGQGHTLDAKFKALEYGLLTVEDKAGMMRRFPIAKLTVEDRKFAEQCHSLQPRAALAVDVIQKAAARLDETILAGLKRGKQEPNPPANDETFARRLYLDVVGRIPTRDEITTFLADSAPDKRSKLVDSLLHSPGYTMQMFNYLADMLRVKDDYGKGAKAFVFEDWLKDMVAINRPWDAMVNDMLTADGKLVQTGPAGFLLRDAQMPLDGVSNLLTTFLGANVSCAQCHDHPLAEWTQKDFYQIAAFFGATDGFHEDVAKDIKKLAKSSDGNKAMAQMLASNAYDLVDMKQNKLAFPKDYKYDNAKPGQKVTPALITWTERDKLSPAYKVDTQNPSQLRDEFSKWMTSAENPRFATAIANRIWRKAFGLAVQEPVSDLDDPKAASNPELLAHITTYMKQAKFDLREFQRIIFNTAAYQREASPTPDLGKGHFLFAGPLLRRLSAEQAWDSLVTLASGKEVDLSILRRGDELKLTAVDGRMTAAAAMGVKAKLEKEGVNLRGGGGGGGKKNPQINARALSQFYDGVRPQERGGLLLARASELPQPAPESHFLRLFGQSDRMVSDTNTTDGSVPQVMSLMNGPVQQVATGAGSSVLTEIDKLSNPPAKIEALYLSYLGRRPTAAEQQRLTAAMADGLTTPDCAWALLNTREFLFVR
jgi:hypothetical protein